MGIFTEINRICYVCDPFSCGKLKYSNFDVTEWTLST